MPSACMRAAVALGTLLLVSGQTAPAPPGATMQRTPGPAETVGTGEATLTAPTPSVQGTAKTPASSPASAPLPSPQAAPGTPGPQPAGYPQVSNAYDVRNPEASEDLPMSGLLEAAGGTSPEQFHIAVTGDGGMYVSWLSGASAIKQGTVELANVACTASIVQYGTRSDALNQRTEGSATAYTQLYGLTYGIEQNYSSPYIHHVKLEDLTPNTTYYYNVGDGTPAGTSEVMNFTSAPPVGTTGFRLLMFADLGQTYNSSSTLDHMRASLADNTMTSAAPHLIYVGDYTYSDDYQSNGTVTDDIPRSTKHLQLQSYQPREDTFGRFISPLTQTYPFMGCVGNHEIQVEENYSNTTAFKSWLARFVHPWRESGSSSPFFYSYNYGAAHVISIANYVWPNYQYDGEQYQWLQQDLAAVNRTDTPWIIVQFHNPWYSTYSYTDFKQMDCFRQILEPLLYTYGVDLVYNGHVHSYERFYPVNDWKIDQCGYTSIVIGDGGNSEGLTTQFVDTPGVCTELSHGAYYFQDICPTDAAGFTGAYFPGGNVSGFCPPTNFQPSPSAFREPSFGHGTLDIINATTALWTWHRNMNGTRVTADQYHVTRDPTACPNKAGGADENSVPKPAIFPVPAYHSATCGPACNNYTGFAPGYGTDVDASGSLSTPASPLSCPVESPGGAPSQAPGAAPNYGPTVSTAGK